MARSNYFSMKFDVNNETAPVKFQMGMRVLLCYTALGNTLRLVQHARLLLTLFICRCFPVLSDHALGIRSRPDIHTYVCVEYF
jgi:hypothetical protein